MGISTRCAQSDQVLPCPDGQRYDDSLYVFVQPLVNALGNEKLQDQTQVPGQDEGATLRSQPQIFDVSGNQLMGTVPEFLLANNVPIYVRPNVNIKVCLTKFLLAIAGPDVSLSSTPPADELRDEASPPFTYETRVDRDAAPHAVNFG